MKILIIDDHPLIIDSYISALKVVMNLENLDFLIDVAHSCDEAIEKLEFIDLFDIVFLDMRIPPSVNGKFLSGEDIGLFIRKTHSKTKIIISTTINNNHRIHCLLKSLDPDCFMVKNDITAENLVTSIVKTIYNPPVYSDTILQHLRQEMSHDLLLDEIDRKMLYELSKGARMKDLPDILPLSIAGIERRKRQLKQIFNLKTNSDLELLDSAREKGFI